MSLVGPIHPGKVAISLAKSFAGATIGFSIGVGAGIEAHPFCRIDNRSGYMCPKHWDIEARQYQRDRAFADGDSPCIDPIEPRKIARCMAKSLVGFKATVEERKAVPWLFEAQYGLTVLSIKMDTIIALALGTFGACVGWKRGPKWSLSSIQKMGQKTMDASRNWIMESARKRSN